MQVRQAGCLIRPRNTEIISSQLFRSVCRDVLYTPISLDWVTPAWA